MVIQNLFTVEEALAYLARETGLAWSENQFFESVSRYGVTMRAVAPKDAVTIIRELRFPPVDALNPLPEKMRLSPGYDLLAVVHPYRVAECWLRGETSTSHPAGYDEVEGELRMFSDPAKVARADLRITRDELTKLLKKSQRLDALFGDTSKSVLTGQEETSKQADRFDSAGEPRKPWLFGMNRVAWEVARSLWEKSGTVSFEPLFDQMTSRTDVKIRDKDGKKQLVYCGTEFASFKGETVLESTVKNDWASKLNKLFKTRSQPE